MLKGYLKLLTGACAIAACATVAAPKAAEAFTWTYGMDSAYDGTGGGLNGEAHGVGPQSKYEAFGMAFTADNDTVTFAFNANFGIGGHYSSGAHNNNITWGDFFLNLDPSKNFTDSKAAGSVLGIRFAEGNESNQSGTGIFSDVTTTATAGSNNGWTSYGRYNRYVRNKGGSVELIDGMTRRQSQRYLGSHGQNSISGGTKIGDISILNDSALANMGLDFASQGGAGVETFGFSFARSLLPGGSLDWVAHVMAECTNDTVGMTGEFAAQTPPPGGNPGDPGNPGTPPNEAVPEPFSMIGAGLALGAGAVLKKRQK
ncbi:MAG: PEP-CTERM sorting domain-containing protein [Spirulina sp. SIO3F2]|nr:PEP-CTERM sorting domain-containing protein [Spirulina sp. SIO3F2]